ncbi:MAG: hypothetical protein K2W95_06790 [Candidatus Obscuribacterales bacterium]|nr:hypothetical protein [Candidatus Obscuribacterales bacterium]
MRRHEITPKRKRRFVAKPLLVRSGSFVVAMRAGSIAQLKYRNKVLTVRNLCDPKVAGIKVISGTTPMAVRAGTEAICYPRERKVEEIFKTEAIARRRTSSGAFTSTHGIATAEVSLITLVPSSNVLSSLFKSKNPDHRILCTKMLKTAACLGLVTAGHGQYGQANDQR